LVVDAELNDIRTASADWDALPIQANGSTWGDEVYFRIPVEAELENGQEVVTLAVFFVPAFLGLERVVLVPGLARGGDPQVPYCSPGCECGVQVSILLLIWLNQAHRL